MNTRADRIRIILAIMGAVSVAPVANAQRASHLSQTQHQTVQQVVRKSLPSVVGLTVRGEDGKILATGSGFVVGQNRVATNLHVVQDAFSVTVNFADGHSVASEGLRSLEAAPDVAIIQVPTYGIRPLPLADYPLGIDQVGATVVAIGSPRGLDGSVSTGIISAVRRSGGCKVIQTTAPLSHGSSGGPLLDENGRVVGITSFILVDGQNLNFAYAVGYVQQALREPYDSNIPWRAFQAALAKVRTQPQNRRAVTVAQGERKAAEGITPPDLTPSERTPIEPPAPSVVPQPPASVAPTGQGSETTSSPNIRDIVVTRRVRPSIPESLQGAEDLQKTVVITFRVRKDGTFTIKMTSSGNAQVDQIIRSAMESWAFKPAMEDGMPVERSYEVRIDIKQD